MDHADLVVIGAGVVGLAIARAAALKGAEVVIVERHDAFGTETSARNSEVIHAGMYYAPGSAKARHCVAGRRALYAYLDARGIPYRRTGKLIVATTEAEEAQLATIAQRAKANGLTGPDRLQSLTGAQTQAMEPALSVRAALWSPETGILDSHALMQSLLAEAEGAGAVLATGTNVALLDPGPPHALHGTSGGAPFALAARRVVVAAGLHTAALCAASGLPAPASHWLKGSYFLLDRRGPFSRLVYPVPSGGGLGVHVTLDLGGATRFGPDTEPVTTLDTSVDPARAPLFEAAVRRYWPGLPAGALIPGYAGIRPRIEGGDFILHGPADTGHAGLCILHGIESPGLTSCLSLAQSVADTLLD